MSSTMTTQARATTPDNFPRWFLVSAGILIGVSLASVALVRLTGNGPDQRRAAETPQAERHLRFEDRPDGSIAVIDGRSGRLVTAIQGEQAFVRGALRALARDRKARGLGSEHPFELVVRPDGSLSLVDPVTQQRIDLNSFGPTHAGAFAALLDPSAPPSSTSPRQP
jgi:putative photosynthetic complex assembly protein